MRWLLALLWLVGCGNAPNGAPCDDGGDCASNFCEGNICSSGKCPRAGDACGDADGWVCVQHDTFFGPFNECELLCSAAEPRCPQWYSCVDDVHCEYGSMDIRYSPSVPVVNEPVTFTALFFDDRRREQESWGFEMNGSVQSFTGESATVSFTSAGEVRAGFLAKYYNEAAPYQAAVRLTIQP
jgi:hypothetical protein